MSRTLLSRSSTGFSGVCFLLTGLAGAVDAQQQDAAVVARAVAIDGAAHLGPHWRAWQRGLSFFTGAQLKAGRALRDAQQRV